jgi:long-chain-alcohol oxidase
MEGVRATRVLRDRDGKAVGVEGVLSSTGIRLRITASVVVVASGALGTPQLLQASGLRNPNIGKNLSVNPATLVLATFVNKRVPITTFGSYQCTEAPNVRVTVPDIPPHLLARLCPWTSALHHKLLMVRYSHMLPLLVSTTTHDIPQTNSLVPMSASSPKIHAPPTSSVESSLIKGVLTASAVAVSAGADSVWTAQAGVQEFQIKPGDRTAWTRAPFWEWQRMVQDAGLGPLLSLAQTGTCRMAGTEALGAVNPDGETFECGNLFVADGSLLPTPAGVEYVSGICFMLYATHIPLLH